MLDLFLQNLRENNSFTMFELLVPAVGGRWSLVFALFGLILFMTISTWWVATRFRKKQQKKYLANQSYTLLAIDLPFQGEQSPKAVEQMFAHLSSAVVTPKTWKEKWIFGVTQTPLSFEIISIEGSIQFVIYTTEANRDFVEAALYAQYPDAEVYEVEDYAIGIPEPWPQADFDLWAAELVLEHEEYYPLRTYLYFEHQLFKKFNDPLAALLEAMGRLGAGEQLWIQYVTYPTTDKQWKDAGEKKAKDIAAQKKPEEKKDVFKSTLGFVTGTLENVVAGVLPPAKPAEKKTEEKPGLTKGEQNVIEAIQTKVAKIGYPTNIRIVYWGIKQSFSKAKRVGSVLGSFRQYTSLNLNGFKTGGKKSNHSQIVKRYQKRERGEGDLKPFILNIEELASLWHFPSPEISAQRIKRTAGRKFGAPENLPIGSHSSTPLSPETFVLPRSPEVPLGAPDNLPV